MNLFSNRLVTFGVAGVMAVGLVGGAGIALAEGGDTPSTPTPTAGQPKDHPGKPGLGRITIAEIAQASGVSVDVLKHGLKDGKSIQQILQANGKDPAAVKAKVLADLKTKLDALVAQSKLTAAQEAKILQHAPQALDRLFSHVPDPNRKPGEHREAARDIVKVALASAAGAIGITPEQLRTELKADGSIAAVAAAHHVSVDTVINRMVADATAAIDKAVADKKLDPAKAARLKAGLKDHITKFVNAQRPKPKSGN